MNRICTTIEQSKKLIELGLDVNTADMVYVDCEYLAIRDGVLEEDDIPAWSIAALLDVLPKVINHETLFIETSPALWHIGYRKIYIERADNPVDACYELILKLHKLNLL